MRIDRYLHDERLTWGASGVLMVVAAFHVGAILHLLLVPPTVPMADPTPPVFEISLQKLPPPSLPPPPEEIVAPPLDAPPPMPEAVKPPPRQTRPVPILVDTPTANPVPAGTQVRPYEPGDELLPGVPGPPVTGGTPDGVGFDDSPGPRGPVFTSLRLVDFVQPSYPPRCLRLGVEGRVKIRVLVGEDGRPQEVTVDTTSGDSSLDEAAMKAVWRWRFEPAARNGAPVRAWVKVPVEFKLID
jgi:protein TonB